MNEDLPELLDPDQLEPEPDGDHAVDAELLELHEAIEAHEAGLLP